LKRDSTGEVCDSTTNSRNSVLLQELSEEHVSVLLQELSEERGRSNELRCQLRQEDAVKPAVDMEKVPGQKVSSPQVAEAKKEQNGYHNEFSEVKPVIPGAPLSQGSPVSLKAGTIFSDEEERYYNMLWMMTATDERLPEASAKALLAKSALPAKVIARIWTATVAHTRGSPGSVDISGFYIACRLVAHAQAKTHEPEKGASFIPREMPEFAAVKWDGVRLRCQVMLTQMIEPDSAYFHAMKYKP